MDRAEVEPRNFYDTLQACRVFRVASCTAVGGSERRLNDGGVLNSTLIESCNGTLWSFVPSPNNPTSVEDVLRRDVS